MPHSFLLLLLLWILPALLLLLLQPHMLNPELRLLLALQPLL